MFKMEPRWKESGFWGMKKDPGNEVLQKRRASFQGGKELFLLGEGCMWQV